MALAGQSNRQIDGDGGFPNSALSAVNAYLGLDLGKTISYLAFLLPGPFDLFQARGLLGRGHAVLRRVPV